MILGMTELWRPAPGFEDHYSVSSLGRVRRDAPGPGTRAGRILKASPVKPPRGAATTGWYRQVGLSVNGRVTLLHVHVLVAQTFIGPCPPGKEVNHKNGDKTDAHADNLEYATHQENMAHAARSGLLPRGGRHSAETIAAIRALQGRGLSQQTVAQRYGTSQCYVGELWRGLKRKHG